MRKLRSPWTVLALVPVFFLAGFAIVSATAGESDGTAAPVAPATTAEQAATTIPATTADATTDEATTAPAGTTGPAPAQVTTTAPAPPSPPPTTTEPPTTGAPPPGPKPGVIVVDYGEWKDAIRISKTKIVQGIATATVEGEFLYLGGGKCKPESVELRALFYDEERIPVGQGFWETRWATGERKPLPKTPLAMEVYGNVRHATTAATVRIYKVTCV